MSAPAIPQLPESTLPDASTPGRLSTAERLFERLSIAERLSRIDDALAAMEANALAGANALVAQRPRVSNSVALHATIAHCERCTKFTDPALVDYDHRPGFVCLDGVCWSECPDCEGTARSFACEPCGVTHADAVAYDVDGYEHACCAAQAVRVASELLKGGVSK